MQREKSGRNDFKSRGDRGWRLTLSCVKRNEPPLLRGTIDSLDGACISARYQHKENKRQPNQHDSEYRQYQKRNLHSEPPFRNAAPASFCSETFSLV